MTLFITPVYMSVPSNVPPLPQLKSQYQKPIFTTEAKRTIQYPCKLTLSQGPLKLLMRDGRWGACFMF